jgi:hypothetical protein
VLIEQTFLLALVVVTAVAAYALGVGALGLRPGQLRAAAHFAFQLIGL